MRRRIIAGLCALACACGTFQMQMPHDFDADAIAVLSRQSTVEIGDWHLTNVHRANTGAGSITSKTGKDQRRRETYRFVASRDTSLSNVMCSYSAGARLASRGEYDYVEDANLTCNVSGFASWQFDLTNTPSHRLSGDLHGAAAYEIRGLAAPTGPVNGFVVEGIDGPVAAVQITGKPRAYFARSLPGAQRDALIPVLGALILLEEQ